MCLHLRDPQLADVQNNHKMEFYVVNKIIKKNSLRVSIHYNDLLIIFIFHKAIFGFL